MCVFYQFTTEADYIVLIEELSHIKGDVGFSEVTRLGEEQKVLKSAHTFYRKAKPEGSKQGHGVGFFFTSLQKNFVEFSNINERFASVAFRLNDRCRLMVVHVHAPTSTNGNEGVDMSTS